MQKRARLPGDLNQPTYTQNADLTSIEVPSEETIQRRTPVLQEDSTLAAIDKRSIATPLSQTGVRNQ